MTGVIFVMAVMLYFLIRIEQHVYCIRVEAERAAWRADRAAMLEREGVE